jgi:hypothetical protein
MIFIRDKEHLRRSFCEKAKARIMSDFSRVEIQRSILAEYKLQLQNHGISFSE